MRCHNSARRAMDAWLPDPAYPELMPLDAWPGLMRVIQTIYWWTALLALLAWAARLLNGPWPGLRSASEAVYPWCMLHQSLIMLAACWLIPLRLGPVWEPGLMLAITAAGCLLIHEFLIRRTSWLRPLSGLPRLARPARSTCLADADASTERSA